MNIKISQLVLRIFKHPQCHFARFNLRKNIKAEEENVSESEEFTSDSDIENDEEKPKSAYVLKQGQKVELSSALMRVYHKLCKKHDEHFNDAVKKEMFRMNTQLKAKDWVIYNNICPFDPKLTIYKTFSKTIVWITVKPNKFKDDKEYNETAHFDQFNNLDDQDSIETSASDNPNLTTDYLYEIYNTFYITIQGPISSIMYKCSSYEGTLKILRVYPLENENINITPRDVKLQFYDNEHEYFSSLFAEHLRVFDINCDLVMGLNNIADTLSQNEFVGIKNELIEFFKP